ncbi:MAG: SsrA-binding protein SmpB [Calditrichaeota bacterium]|nr:MAG: SsrA-binding protein SmpB [Calditrichota bacterium]
MSEKIITVNRKARHDYEIIDTFEAGLVLLGTEVKSLRDGKANLKDSYARLYNGEMWLHGTHISVYSHGTYNNHDPERQRKLLLHKKELRKLIGRVEEAGLTLVPLKLYFKRGKAKVQIALARGKRQYDKRHDIAKRDAQREIARKMKQHLR